MKTVFASLLKIALIMIALSCFFFLLCDKGTDRRTEKAIQWVNSHPKPIIVTSVACNGITMNYRCLLKDSAGVFYYAGKVRGFQSDTIK